MAATQREPTEPKLAPEDLRLARAIFTLRETGGYLGVPKSTIHEWARPADGRSPLMTVFPASRARGDGPVPRLG